MSIKKKPKSAATRRSKTSSAPTKRSSKSKPAVKKSAKKAAKRTATPRVSPTLTTTARRKLLKPKDSFADVVEKTARALAARREIRVPGTNASKLKALTAKAIRAAQRENRVREQLEKMLRPLSDARLLAEDAAYRALLDVYAAVKLYARNSPEIAEEFGFLTEHLTFSRERAEPQPPPAPQPPEDPPSD